MATAFSETLTPYKPVPRLRDIALQVDEQFRANDVEGVNRWGNAAAAPVIISIGEAVERAEFRKNYSQWLWDSEIDSFPDCMKEHDSYRAIVARGDRVIPLIAAALRNDPSFIFLALEDITGENPVPEGARGNLSETVRAWLNWLSR